MRVGPLTAACIAAVAMPFVITGVYWLLPIGTPWFIVPVTLAAAAAGTMAVRRRPSPVAVGALVGTSGWTVFLIWLFASFSFPD